MGSSLARIKRRIASIDSTRKITNAMKLVSSVKLLRKRKAMDSTIDYVSSLQEVMSSCMEGMDMSEMRLASPLMLEKTGEKAKGDLYVIITSDLGLCGGYNINIVKFLKTLIKEDDTAMVLGSKGLSKLRDEDISSIDSDNVSILNKFNFSSALNLREKISTLYIQGEYKHVYLVYTKFKNALTFIPSCETILPLEKIDINVSKNDNKNIYPPEFLPNKKDVFALLIPKYLDLLIYERIIESGVCEEGSRRNAMESATDNADELRSNLNIEYNKARQAEITSQITEIVSGRVVEE